jgi:hypothetical protein
MLRFNRIFVFFFEKALEKLTGFPGVYMIMTMECTDDHLPKNTYNYPVKLRFKLHKHNRQEYFTDRSGNPTKLVFKNF